MQLKTKYSEVEHHQRPLGDELYTYHYRDENGNLVAETINTQEKIQSYLSKVDYKQKIALGLGLEVPIENPNMVADATGLPESTVDIVKLVDSLNNLSKDEIAAILSAGSQPDGTVNQTTTQSSTTGDQTQETTTETGQTIPDTGATSSTTT